MTPELFQQYLNGLCTKEERDQVEHWLHTSSGQQLDEVLLPRFNNNNIIMPQQQSDALWQSIKPPRRINYLAIAASLLLLVMAGWWMMDRPVQKRPVVVQHVIEDTLITTEQEIKLPDGSTVLLSKHSTLKYQKTFTTRNLYLQGKAIFKVAKDKSRPFTVYSSGISTTALGTVFLVNTTPDKITVKLLEGKVVVRHGTETLLIPGQQLIYDIHKQIAIVHKPSRPKPPVRIQKERTIKELAFNNAPLPEVLEKLKIQYAANISYDKTALDGLYFTGAIAVTDALPVILKAITQMNGLELQVQSNNYSIQPASR